MENIYEKSVVKPRDLKDNLITLFTVLGTVGLIVFLYLIEPVRQFIFAIAAGLIYLAYRIITGRNIEYEYILAGNSIAMDKIINKSRRKRVFNCDLTDFDIVAPVESDYYREYVQNTAKILEMVSGDNKADEYFGLTEYKGKRTMLIFETDEKAREHIRRHLDFKFKQ